MKFLSKRQTFTNLAAAMLASAACHTAVVPSSRGNGPTANSGYVTAADGARLYYRILGAGPDTIVALHGGPGETLASFDPALQPLSRAHALLLYDQRGNGGSSAVDDSTHVTIAYHISDLETILRHFRIQRAIILGHSWGGDLAALYAAAHPAAIRRLILVDPGPPRQDPYDADSRRGRFAGFDAATQALVGSLGAAALADTASDKPALCRSFYNAFLKNYFVDHEAMRGVVANDCSYPGYTMRAANRISVLTERSGYDHRQWDTLVRAVDAPVLVIHGANDFIPLASSRTWASSFPHARLLIIDRSSHFPFVDRPDLFFPAVEAFLSGGWPADAR